MKISPILFFSMLSFTAIAQNNPLRSQVNTKADALKDKIITWRRDFHEHPELGNHEVRTSGIIAKHLQSLGIEVKTGIATTGVVGILKGGKPGPVVALRADMDGLPVIERTNVPFASKVKTTYNGQEVGVMHACGHDSHMAILMGVAEILSGMKKDLHGTVKFIFQPAEEGVEPGQKGGAEEMVKEGVLENPKVDVVFGLHINSQTEVGKLTYRPGGTMAGVNDMQIIVKGRSAHGAYPWSSIDPIVVSAEIINNLQTIVSRNINVTENPAVVTIGSIKGGNRSNIIPESVEMLGTLRSFTAADEKLLVDRVTQIATKTAEAQGATATVKIPYSTHYPVTFNDVALTQKMLPSLQQTAGAANVLLRPPVTGAEDFSFYQEKVPGLFFFLGGMPKGEDPEKAPSHHTPDFYIDESGFTLGVKALCNLTLDYMAAKK
ncbi:carboxypeptidase Ss1. Metallo peptidase. MEROPS family M20D [Mucilaginibacter pineti]|uniref:Carboxypeptidase Ss1. Metallo peptidase. MEROPS family M20D n=1 Tax=Mucilaginibacter pineti TaxID=1391627 RepID=A0A1G7AEC6_9SPHI|nr:amidohydrolase [Mucilaginibacter pineti]SDE13171.1 carboxypeptidase Ss1. Metallo peptidase. MEROPS family M20D [Mucilaginibacter pineti]